jgi:hypothetical protein
VGADCGLHTLIHTLACKDPSAKCGSGFFRDEVWIKVCNVHFQQNELNKKSGAEAPPCCLESE